MPCTRNNPLTSDEIDALYTLLVNTPSADIVHNCTIIIPKQCRAAWIIIGTKPKFTVRRRIAPI
jgi:hypothetical protein